MTNTGSTDEIIRHRRIVKPALMDGSKIPDETIRALLELADWAPTHGHTEPWRYVVFAGEGVSRFCSDHAELYREHTSPDKFTQASFEKLESMGDNASHIIALCMRRGDNPKIPEEEEMAATACAAQNILLGATARDLAVYWGTGGMTYHPALKEYLGLREEDRVLGFLYLGHSAAPAGPGKRITPLQQKVRWVS